MDTIIAKLKECFDISDFEPIDFENIDRNNPPIFGPEDIFDDIYGCEDDDTGDIIFIVVALLTAFIAIIISFNIFFDCINYIEIF